MTGARSDIRLLVSQITGDGRPAARPAVWAVAAQFFYKELQVWLGYGSLVLLNFLEIGLLIGTYYFLGALVPRGRMAEYGTDYFSFVLVGLAFQHFIYEIFFATDENTRREQAWGTVEAVLVTPTSAWKYGIGNYTCYYFYTWLYVLLVLGLGNWLLGGHVVITPGTIWAMIVISGLLVTSHVGLGLAAMGMILVNKAANPAATLFDWAERLFCGVFFPVSVLPAPLQALSQFLPLTYALRALRNVLLAGEGLTSPVVVKDLLWLVLFTAILMPVGMAVLAWGYRRARTLGTLGQY
ncbi:MAG TPA: ABC transporter permease [Symbiobacteriaceae bacterium]|nr:ABC transporter permease [Symbiobacteriaceae bacterium]